MKKALFTFAVLLGISQITFALDNGLYECTNGNEESICPQIVETIKEDRKLSGLKIYYSGYCNDQGPFYYDCDKGTCGNGAIEFSKIKKNSFHWQNIPHGFHCDFVKK